MWFHKKTVGPWRTTEWHSSLKLFQLHPAQHTADIYILFYTRLNRLFIFTKQQWKKLPAPCSVDYFPLVWVCWTHCSSVACVSSTSAICKKKNMTRQWKQQANAGWYHAMGYMIYSTSVQFCGSLLSCDEARRPGHVTRHQAEQQRVHVPQGTDGSPGV